MKSKELWEENEQSKHGDEDYGYTEPCKCACHENKLHKQYAHSGQCCENMNGYIKNCDCATKYCKHYKSDFDKFLEATAEVTIEEYMKEEQRLCEELLNFIHGKEYEIYILRFMEEYREKYHPEVKQVSDSR